MTMIAVETKHTARKWEILLRPGSCILDIPDESAYYCTPITLAEFQTQYGSLTCGVRKWKLDLSSLPVGQKVKIETFSGSLYTFVYKGTADHDTHAIVDVIGSMGKAVVEESVMCDRSLIIGSPFQFGSTRTSLVVEFWLWN